MATPIRKRSVADRLTADTSRDANAPIDSLVELFTRRVESVSVRRILLAAVDSFAKHGFHAASTRDIAKRAKLSPAAVYVHFRSKEELLYTLVTIISEWVYDRMLVANRAGGAPVDLMRRLVVTHVASHASMRAALFLVEYEFNSLSPVQRKKILKVRDGMESLFKECLAAGIAQGAFKVVNESLTNVAIVSLCVSVLNWFSPKGPLTPEAVGLLYADLVLSMLQAAQPPARSAPVKGAALRTA